MEKKLNRHRHFLTKGVPLAASSFFDFGLPSFFMIAVAGHVPDSATVQAALGFGRVFFNATFLMLFVSCQAYFANAVPGCIGAKRMDRCSSSLGE